MTGQQGYYTVKAKDVNNWLAKSKIKNKKSKWQLKMQKYCVLLSWSDNSRKTSDSPVEVLSEF